MRDHNQVPTLLAVSPESVAHRCTSRLVHTAQMGESQHRSPLHSILGANGLRMLFRSGRHRFCNKRPIQTRRPAVARARLDCTWLLPDWANARLTPHWPARTALGRSDAEYLNSTTTLDSSAWVCGLPGIHVHLHDASPCAMRPIPPPRSCREFDRGMPSCESTSLTWQACTASTDRSRQPTSFEALRATSFEALHALDQRP